MRGLDGGGGNGCCCWDGDKCVWEGGYHLGHAGNHTNLRVGYSVPRGMMEVLMSSSIKTLVVDALILPRNLMELIRDDEQSGGGSCGDCRGRGEAIEVARNGGGARHCPADTAATFSTRMGPTSSYCRGSPWCAIRCVVQESDKKYF